MPTSSRRVFVLAMLILLGTACVKERLDSSPVPVLSTQPLSGASFEDSSGLRFRWPQVFIAESPTSVLWGEGRVLHRMQIAGERLVVLPPVAIESDLSMRPDRLVAGSLSSDGVLGVLDSKGRVMLLDSTTGEASGFDIPVMGSPGFLAVGSERIYVLRDEAVRVGGAVVAYNFKGQEVAHWGEVPSESAIHKALRGGGLALCPGGTVYFSYLNSPRIMEERGGEAVPVGIRRADFQVLPGRIVRSALRESRRSRSVRPLAEAAFAGSRVMSLYCSSDGYLFRQVAEPSGGGAKVEIWSPERDELVGVVPLHEGVLLSVHGNHEATTLFVGVQDPESGFTLERKRVALQIRGEGR